MVIIEIGVQTSKSNYTKNQLVFFLMIESNYHGAYAL